MELTNEQVNTLMWQFVSQHYKDIDKWCMRAARGRRSMADDLFSDEVIRMLPGLIERWDQVRPFYYYARKYFSMHLYKKVRQKERAMQRTESYCAFNNLKLEDKRKVNDPDDAEYVQLLLSHLSDIDRTIVYRSVVLGHTTREIAEDIPYSYTSIASRLNKALQQLKDLADNG